MKERQGANVMVVALSAAAVGAGIALLTAPRSGRETRAQIKDRADRMKLKGQQSATAMRHKINEKMARGKEVRDAFVQSFKATKADLKQDADAHKEQMKSSIINSWKEEV